jgi:hypothetical protein
MTNPSPVGRRGVLAGLAALVGTIAYVALKIMVRGAFGAAFQTMFEAAGIFGVLFCAIFLLIVVAGAILHYSARSESEADGAADRSKNRGEMAEVTPRRKIEQFSSVRNDPIPASCLQCGAQLPVLALRCPKCGKDQLG